MDSNRPIIQILNKSNYEQQHLVKLPPKHLTFPLAPSSIRIKTTMLSLTTNNFNYARLGHLYGWWDMNPLPLSTPVEYSNSKKYGRISCWGWGVVVESKVPEIEVGSQVYGYLPIGTLPVEMKVKLSWKVERQFLETSKHRERLFSLYNVYHFYPASPTADEDAATKEMQGFSALMAPLWLTGFIMNRFLFPWDPAELVKPSSPKDDWTLEKGTLNRNSIVLLFPGSAKTPLGFAYCLKHECPEDYKPRMVVGIGSETSRAFLEGTGLYNKVMTYDAASGDLTTDLELQPDSEIIIGDCGSRDNASERWAVKLRKSCKKVLQVVLASEVAAESPEQVNEALEQFKRDKWAEDIPQCFVPENAGY